MQHPHSAAAASYASGATLVSKRQANRASLAKFHTMFMHSGEAAPQPKKYVVLTIHPYNSAMPGHYSGPRECRE